LEQEGQTMSREKQIEEMIETLKKCSCVYTDCEQECSQCSNEELYDEALNYIARTLYEAGYRKQSEGEWVFDEDRFCYICSVCEHDAPVDYYGEPNFTDFCPECGAKMKGADNEQRETD
jgi:hypothetical protein